MSVLETTTATPQRLHSLKRKRTSDGSPAPISRQNSELGSGSNTPKRNRVASTELKSLERVKTHAWVQQTTLKALENHKQGRDGLYDSLKTKFDQKSLPSSRSKDEDIYDDDDGPPSHEELRKWVIALTKHSHAMGRDSGSLLSAMLGCRWLERDDEFLADFQRFLASLLSAHGGYVPHVLKWLIAKFANVPLEISQIPTLPPVSRDVVFDRIHGTIQLIMKIIPASLGIMTSSISSAYPFPLADVRSYTDYVKNLFRIVSYDKTLEPAILGLIMEHLIVIDVHVGIELEDLDEDDVAGLMESVRDEIIKLETFQIIDTEEMDILLDDQDRAEEAALRSTISALMKLDIVLDLLFSYFNTIVEAEASDVAFKKISQLVSMFTSKILVTHNSRHCQYLIFRFGQLNQPVFETFMEELLSIAFDRNRAIPIRCSAVTYLASYAARGAKLSGDIVRRMFFVFGKEMDRLRGNYEKDAVRGPDPDKYRFFYTLFQACMYLFCFRWHEFLLNSEDYEDGHDDMADLKWQPNVRSTFMLNIHSAVNPLKCCSPLVVGQFAYVSSSLKFMFVNDLIEQNKRVRLTRVATMNTVARDSTLVNNFTEKSLQLEEQYPFEPFSLPRSRLWVDGLYLEFQDPNPNGDGESSDEDEDDEE